MTASTEQDTPQCFLLTPKLLSDLVYSGDVTVLQIMNGPSVPACMVAAENAGVSAQVGGWTVGGCQGKPGVHGISGARVIARRR